MNINGTDVLYMDTIQGNYIREFQAVVKNRKTDSKGNDYLVLDRTAFYPQGGGQPTDTGILSYHDIAAGVEREITVNRVIKKEAIRHYIGESEGTDGIEPGLEVRGRIDWENRFAHMRMHTAQHLVSAIVYNMYNSATVGNQIYADKSRIDFSPLAHDEVDTEEIERQCNELIRMNPQVKIFFENRSVVEESHDAERCNVHLIPQSVRELRIVKIQDVELCPCAGTHVKELEEIRGISITGVKSKGKGKVRITYELL